MLPANGHYRTGSVVSNASLRGRVVRIIRIVHIVSNRECNVAAPLEVNVISRIVLNHGIVWAVGGDSQEAVGVPEARFRLKHIRTAGGVVNVNLMQQTSKTTS